MVRQAHHERNFSEPRIQLSRRTRHWIRGEPHEKPEEPLLENPPAQSGIRIRIQLLIADAVFAEALFEWFSVSERTHSSSLPA
jgi:hypothetical protein